MAELKNYKGSVELMSGLRSKNNRGFPLMQAHDIQVDEDGTRLDEVLERGGAGGVSSWNDLQDKPFYDETYTGTMVFQYDGDPTGKTTVTIPDNGTLVKTSDWTAEPSDLIGATGTFGGQSMVITAEMVQDMRGFGMPIAVVAESLYIVYSPCTVEGIITFPESGTYIADIGVSASLVFTGTVTRVKTLDPKYLPGGFTGGGGSGGGGASNVHVLDIGSADLDVTELDLSNYANGDVLVIVQNMSQ